MGGWEISEVRAISPGDRVIPLQPVDVILADCVNIRDRAREGPPIVTIGDDAIGDVGPRIGIRASLPSDVISVELNAALTAVAMEFTFLTESQARRWLRQPPALEAQRDGVVETLTDRELQILRMLADGMGNKELASELRISEQTAKFHVGRFFRTLGPGAALKQLQLGLGAD